MGCYGDNSGKSGHSPLLGTYPGLCIVIFLPIVFPIMLLPLFSVGCYGDHVCHTINMLCVLFSELLLLFIISLYKFVNCEMLFL